MTFVKAASLITKVPQKQFMAEYMTSPIYKKRLLSMGVTEQPSVQDLLNTNISSIDGASSLSVGKQSAANINSNKMGNIPIIKGVNNINIDRSPQNLDMTKKSYGAIENPQMTLSHELSHVSRMLSPQEEDYIASLNKKPDEAAVYKQYKKSGVVDPFSAFLNSAYDNTHDARPNEIKADLDALRFHLFKNGIYDTSKRDMTIDDINKASQDPDIKNSFEYKRLIQRFKPADIVNLNNNIAANINTQPINLDQQA